MNEKKKGFNQLLAEAIRKFNDSEALEHAKRCPFCGSAPVIDFDDFGCTVRCPNDDCPCSPQTNSTFKSREAAVDMWNRRNDNETQT